jgi:hypothetical protein
MMYLNPGFNRAAGAAEDYIYIYTVYVYFQYSFVAETVGLGGGGGTGLGEPNCGRLFTCLL